MSALTAAIDALPEGLRIALVMHAIEGYTHVEIAAALGIAEGPARAGYSRRGRTCGKCSRTMARSMTMDDKKLDRLLDDAARRWRVPIDPPLDADLGLP